MTVWKRPIILLHESLSSFPAAPSTLCQPCRVQMPPPGPRIVGSCMRGRSAGDQLARRQQSYFSTEVLRIRAICNEGGYSVSGERHVTVCHVYLNGSCWVRVRFGHQRSKRQTISIQVRAMTSPFPHMIILQYNITDISDCKSTFLTGNLITK